MLLTGNYLQYFLKLYVVATVIAKLQFKGPKKKNTCVNLEKEWAPFHNKFSTSVQIKLTSSYLFVCQEDFDIHVDGVLLQKENNRVIINETYGCASSL